MLSPIDGVILAVYLLFSFVVGLLASRRAGVSGDQYFLAGRSLPGWLLGVSIVATTFAADTPLAVAGMVASKGVAANWFWWSMGIAHVGMFLLWSPLWRRSGVTTDAEFAELRYGGVAGRQLRSLKAAFFALLYNAIVLGWVLRAMQKIAQPFARWDLWLPSSLWDGFIAIWPTGTPLGGAEEGFTILMLVGLATSYSTLGGLRGVVITDLMQFGLALIGSFGLAFYAVDAAGGMAAIREGIGHELGAERAAELLSILPSLGGDLSYLPLQALGVYVLLRWWAHPMGDGGGYIAQRLLAARDDREAQQAAGIFVVLHYVVRPWPWIVVGLAGLTLFPPSAGEVDRELLYAVIAGQVLPPGLLGVLLVSLLAAFMSTVDTHLNWGVSYVAHDLWKGRLRPAADGREVVLVGRLASLLFAALAVVVTTQINSVEGAWKFVAALGSGIGLPSLLRWVWWRTNAQAEMAGALGSLSTTIILSLAAPDLRYEWMLAAAVTSGVLAALWAIHHFGPPDEATLRRFHDRVRPPGIWGPFREGGEGGALAQRDAAELRLRLLAWATATLALFGAMFAPGYLLLGKPSKAAACLLALIMGVVATKRLLSRVVER